MIKRASTLVTASFAAFMAGTSPSQATAPIIPLSDLGTSFKSKTSRHIQLADIGGWFNDVTKAYSNNRSILDLDQKFQSILGDIGEIHRFEGPFNENIYGPYSDDMEFIAGNYNDPNIINNYSVDRQIDLCTSEVMSDFYKKYLNKVKNYLADNPNVDTKIGNTQKRLQELETGIQALDEINKALRNKLIKTNEVPACGTLVQHPPAGKLNLSG